MSDAEPRCAAVHPQKPVTCPPDRVRRRRALEAGAVRDWLDAFWIWFGRVSAKGRVEGHKAAVLMEAFHAGWEARKEEEQRMGGPG